MKRSSPPVVVPAPEWRTLLKAGKVAGLAMKGMIERAADGSVSFTASSADADRYGDTIVQAGGKLENFKRNPVILWAHSHYTPPVGKAPAAGLNAAGNLSTGPITWTNDEEHKFGAEVGRMVAGGFLNAVSIGFLPLAWEERYDEGGRFKGYNFTSWELLEISVVPVPANPQALIEGRGFAKSLADWCNVPDDSGPMARGFQNELQGWFKAAADVQTAAADAADAGDFSHMIALLERIAKATEAPRFTVRLGEFEVSGPDIASVKALLQSVTKQVEDLPADPPAPAPPADEVAKAAPVTDAGGDLTSWLAGG